LFEMGEDALEREVGEWDTDDFGVALLDFERLRVMGSTSSEICGEGDWKVCQVRGAKKAGEGRGVAKRSLEDWE
jgi:hypothetical protein